MCVKYCAELMRAAAAIKLMVPSSSLAIRLVHSFTLTLAQWLRETYNGNGFELPQSWTQ